MTETVAWAILSVLTFVVVAFAVFHWQDHYALWMALAGIFWFVVHVMWGYAAWKIAVDAGWAGAWLLVWWCGRGRRVIEKLLGAVREHVNGHRLVIVNEEE